MTASLNGGSVRVLWDADDTAEVTITGGGSAVWTVNGSTVTFPYTLSSSTTFETTHAGSYDVSVEHHGYEVASTPDGTRNVELRFGEQVIFSPTPDGTPNNKFMSDLHGSLSATIATGIGGAGLRYINVYDGFFAGQDSLDNPAIWANSSHLNATGLDQWADYIATNADITGTAPKVVWFGDSWISQDPTVLAASTVAVKSDAVVVNAGVSGNTSTQMLDRFDADVPTDADYVIFNEPGVNDIYQNLTPAEIIANLEALVSAIRGIGAVPIFTGMVPLSDHPDRTATRHAELTALIGDGYKYPAAPASAVARPIAPNASSYAVGGGLSKVTTGISNTALGIEAGRDLTTGNSNTAMGNLALRVCATGGFNAAVGQGALSAATGSESTAVGAYALLSLTTGAGNTAIGKSAGYAPGGVADNAITAGSYNVCIGMESGTRTTQSYTTSIGYRAVADGYRSMALGAYANCAVAADGSVAIGQDSTGVGAAATADNDFILGTGNHNVKVPGRFNVATRTPTGSADAQGQTGDITWDADYVYVKTAAGWKRSALTAW